MGRPLNKKYFGNRNVGTDGYESSDDFIGGEGLASISISDQGNFAGNGAVDPLVGLALPAPTIPGGVQATWDIVYEVSTVTTGAGSVGLVVGDTYTYAGTGGAVFTVATSTNNGTNATFTVTNRGTGIATVPQDTITVNMTKVTGTGAATFTVDIFFRVKSLTIVEKGSGYTGAETFTVTLNTGASGTVPAGTIVLTTDSGNQYQGLGDLNSNTYQENAIIIYANTSASGSTGKVGDIVKQTNARSYKVKTEDGTKICRLGTDSSPESGEAYIVATDSSNATYYVTKLTAHRAVLVNKTGTPEFEDGTSVVWTFGSAVENYSVTIENA